jgi:hypothetical protein
MRPKRILTQDAWYEIRTAINNREPLFRRRQVVAVFCRVFGEAGKRFAFELRGFALVEERLSFYIRQADGLQIPAIMQWLKQTFSVRFNLHRGRSGHVWGDRYWSRVVEGEPPEWAREVNWEAVDVATETGALSSGKFPADRVSPLTAESPVEAGFSPQNPARPPFSARLSPQTRPRSARNRRHNPLIQCRQATVTGEVCPLPPPRNDSFESCRKQRASLSVEFQSTAPCITTVKSAQQTSRPPLHCPCARRAHPETPWRAFLVCPVSQKANADALSRMAMANVSTGMIE